MRIVIRPGAPNAFGPVLKRIREEARPKLTQADLAARITALGLPIDRSVISRIENQGRHINDIELLYFIKALRLSTEKFINMLTHVHSNIALYSDLSSEEDELEIRVAEEEDLNGFL